jgi:septum formation protein
LFLKSPPSLVLASTSVYRRQLLERLQIAFTCAPPGVDERALAGETPTTLVGRLARAKARSVAARHPGAWVIGSDQVAVLADGADPPAILGKPGTAARCIEQLQRCSGRTLAFLTAVAVVREDEAPGHEFMDTTRVTYRPLDAATIERYVAHEAPLDCAGGVKSEALGISLCESIETTDPTALVGLPLIRLAAVLRQVGFTLP